MKEEHYEIKAYPADQAYLSMTLSEKDYKRFGKMNIEEKQKFISENAILKNPTSQDSEISHYMSARVRKDNSAI